MDNPTLAVHHYLRVVRSGSALPATRSLARLNALQVTASHLGGHEAALAMVTAPGFDPSREPQPPPLITLPLAL
jgi:hypothetical protein